MLLRFDDVAPRNDFLGCVMGGVSTRCRIEKKRRKKIEREHKPESTLMDIPNWKCSKKLQRKKTITTIQIHYNVEITKSKTERETTNMITAQVRSGATVQQTKQPYRAERLRCDSYAQDCYGANSRLSWEKNHGAPSVKVCSKLCGRSTAQGGHRIRLRPVARSNTEAAPHTSIPQPNFPQNDNLTKKRHYRKALPRINLNCI